MYEEEKDEIGYYIGANDKRCEHDIKNNIYPCDIEREYWASNVDED